MFKNWTFLLFISFIISCQSEPTKEVEIPSSTDQQEAKPMIDQKTNTEKFEEIRNNAFDEGDVFGRVNHSLGIIQKLFHQSNKLQPQAGKQSIFVDEKLNVIVRKKVGEDVFDVKFNLKNIDHQQGGMHLIADKELDDWPGFAVGVIEGKPAVEIIENGKKIKEEKELQIFMADRTLIEKTVPAMIQAINVVHGRN